MAIQVGGFEKGPGGIARVTHTGKNVKIAFKDSGETYTILPEDIPSWLTENGTYNIMLDAECVRVVSCRPGKRCSSFAQVIGFGAKEGEKPAPVMVKGGVKEAGGKRWEEPDSLQFKVIYRLVGGEYDGFEISQRFTYAFFPDGMGGTAIRGRGQKKLAEFLQVVGFDFSNDTIPYAENVLPWLEAEILDKNKIVMLELNDKGWIQNVSEPPSGIDIPKISAKKKAIASPEA